MTGHERTFTDSDGNEVPSLFSQSPSTLSARARLLDAMSRKRLPGMTLGITATPEYGQQRDQLTGLECGGFGEDILVDSPEDQMAGRVLRVSQSAPQVEVIDAADASESQTGFAFLGALGTLAGGNMITGSAPQQLIEEMPQPPQEGGIN